MPAPPDDWRRRGQENYLRDARLTWKHYQALSADWEHEHCEFCFQKFLDPNYSPVHADTLRQHPDQQVAAGYTNLEDDARAPGRWWICEQCFADFRDEFGWVIVDSDPDAWPYPGPEPEHRPTAANYDESHRVE